MTETIQTIMENERAIGLATQLPGQSDAEVRHSLEELRELLKTADVEMVGTLIQKRDRTSRALYMGTGKIEEIAEAATAAGANLIVADDELTALQIKTIEEAGISPRDIDCIFANANSTPTADRVESMIIKDVFGDYGKQVPVTATKSMTGECYSVSGAFAVAAALGAIQENFIPPTINYQVPDPECDLNIIANKAVEAQLNNVLVVNFSPSGANMCMVLRRVKD